ncbi:hypothetical protein PMAYCL1PPCAC_03291, partial [Pristionchus mayeri]
SSSSSSSHSHHSSSCRMVVVARIVVLLGALALTTHAGSILSMFGHYKDVDTCQSSVKKALDGSYPTFLYILLAVGPIASIVLLAVNIAMYFYIKKKLVVEVDNAMQKCFEVLDNVLVELMPRKIQTQLQTAINGKSGKTDSKAESKNEGGKTAEDNKSAAEQSAVQSAASQVSTQ